MSARRVSRPHIVDWNALRLLSVKDPWFKLLGLGLKPYELRSRVTHYRGPVVLVSSLRASTDKWAALARSRNAPWVPEPPGAAGFIGQLVDCFPAQRCAEHAQRACCPPPKGMWVWEFEHVWRLPEPFPVIGQLGLYPAPMSLRRYLRQVLV